MSEKFDIYSKIFFRDVGNFFRHLCELVLRHQMPVSNYFVKSFYSAGLNFRGALLEDGETPVKSFHSFIVKM
jgi:hypothetical protein